MRGGVCRWQGRALGRRLGLARTELVEVELGALLHDVGKLCLPRELLEKPGELTTEERRLIRLHPDWAPTWCRHPGPRGRRAGRAPPPREARWARLPVRAHARAHTGGHADSLGLRRLRRDDQAAPLQRATRPGRRARRARAPRRRAVRPSSTRWSRSSGRTSKCPPEGGAAAARRQPLTTPVLPKTGIVPPASFTMFRQSRSTTSGLSPATSFSSSGSASVSNRRRSLPWLSAIRR